MSSPSTPVKTPKIPAITRDVCTDFSTCSLSPRPIYRATTTFVPIANHMKIFRNRPIMAAVVPMAPIAPSTPDMPAIIMSAAL